MNYQSTRHPEIKFALNPRTKENFDILINGIINHNQDMVIVVDGEEGVGKSQSTRQLALYCAEQLDTPFDREGLGNVYTSMNAYITAFEQAQADGLRGWVGVLDESRAILGKARHNNKEVKAFTDWLSEARDIGGCHFILLPRFHDLHKYVVLNRMSMLINLKKEFRSNPNKMGGQDLILGGYKLYAAENYLYGAYFMPYKYPTVCAVQDRFSNVEVMTPKGLERLSAQKKLDRDTRRQLNTEEGIDKNTVWLNGLLSVLQSQGHKAVSLARILGITRQSLNNRLQSGKQTIIYSRWKKSLASKEETEDGDSDDD